MSKLKNKKTPFINAIFIMLLGLNFLLPNGAGGPCSQTYGYPVYFVKRHVQPYDECLPADMSPLHTYSNFYPLRLAIDIALLLIIRALTLEIVNKKAAKKK